MSDEEELGRGKRAPQKTKAIAEFDKGVKKSQSLRESNQRNRLIRKEKAALDAAEAESAASSKEPKSKSKGKLKGKSGDDLEDERPPPINEIAAELERDEEETMRLTHLVHFRDRIPYDTLGFWSLKELDAQWRKGDGAAPAKGANTKKAAGTSKAKSTKPATATKTPKPKRIAGIVEPCPITMLGSPLLALQSAKKQSARAADNMSPIVLRKRDASTDRSEPGSKRARTATHDKIKPSKSGISKNRSVSGPASFQRKGDLIVMSRSSSQAPSASRASSQVPVTSAPVATSGPALADSDVEMADLSDVEEVVEEPVKVKKKRASKGEAKPRPTRGDYEGVELELQDQTFLILRARLGWDSACPDLPEFNRLVRICWAEAAPTIDTTTEQFPCTRDHIRVLSDRITSYRGHCKKSIQTSATIVYKLDEMEGDMLTAHVDYLCQKVFYTGPKIDKRSGFYEHLFVARALRIMYFLGHNPPALMAPGKFDPMPFNAIAIAMAITEFCIQSYRSGAFKAEEMTFETLRKKYIDHMHNLQVWRGCVSAKEVMLVRKLLYKAASTNSGHAAFIVAPSNPNLLTPADFQNGGDNESEDEPEDEFGLPLDEPKESSSKSKESSSKPSKPKELSSKPSKPKESSSKPSKATESLGKSKGSSSKSKGASSKSKPASSEHTAASSNPAPPPNKPTTSRKPKLKGQGEVSVVLTTPAKPAKPTAPANSSPLESSPIKSSPAKPSSSKPAPSKSGQTEGANGGPGPDSSSSSDSSSGSDSDSNSDSDSGKSKPKPKASGASKRDKSAHIAQSGDSSELSDDEDGVGSLKCGGDNMDAGVGTGKGDGAKAQDKGKDEEDEDEEDEGSKKDKEKGDKEKEEEKDEGSEVEKDNEEAASPAKPVSGPTNNGSKQKSPVPQSSSAPPNPTSLAAEEKEAEDEENPKTKAKGRKKKVSKGKEKDPGEVGSWQGIKTRRALAQSG